MSRPIGRNARGRTGVLIVGGGISGLAAAHRVVELRRGGEVTTPIRLIEASGRLGGQIRTRRSGEYLLEGGPDSVVAAKPAAVELCKRLGIESELLSPRPGPGGTEIVRNGRRIGLPQGFALVAPARWTALLGSPLFSWRGKARIAMERWVPARQAGVGDESIRAFVERRLGHELFERAAEPILGGLFMADTDRYSMGIAMPRFQEMERRHGSITRGLRRAMRRRSGTTRPAVSMWTLRDGLGSLVERLASRLPEGFTLENTAAERLSYDTDSRSWRVTVRGRTEIEAESVVLACPAHVSAKLLAGIDGKLAASLAGLSHASCATVNLVYRRSDVGAALSAHGFFVPRTERLPILAASMVSAKFAGRAPDDTLLVRTFMGGALRPEVLERDDDELVRLSHEALRPLLRIAGRPLLSTTHRSPHSMPQFPVGYGRQVASIGSGLERHPGLYVCGGALGTFGLPDCIRSGEEAGERAARFLESRTRELELAI